MICSKTILIIPIMNSKISCAPHFTRTTQQASDLKTKPLRCMRRNRDNKSWRIENEQARVGASELSLSLSDTSIPARAENPYPYIELRVPGTHETISGRMQLLSLLSRSSSSENSKSEREDGAECNHGIPGPSFGGAFRRSGFLSTYIYVYMAPQLVRFGGLQCLTATALARDCRECTIVSTAGVQIRVYIYIYIRWAKTRAVCGWNNESGSLPCCRLRRDHHLRRCPLRARFVVTRVYIYTYWSGRVSFLICGFAVC